MNDSLTWSPSRSWRWRTCPRQFLLRDVVGAKPAQHEAKNLLRGQVIHAGMEGAIRAVFHEKHREARSMIAFLDEALDAMNEHPAIERLSMPDMADCARVVSSALAVLDVPLPASIIGIELPFSFHHNGIVIDGVIDLALRTGPHSVRVLDWKTGKIPDRTEAIEGHTALGVYSVAALQAWPWARTIDACLYSVPKRKSVNLVVSRAMQELVLSRITADFHAAHHAKALLSPENVDETFPARSGDHCMTCVFRSYCPIFADSDLPVRPGLDVLAERDRIAARISTPE